MEILVHFFDVIESDARIGPTHISLYMALLVYWNRNNYQNPVSVTSRKIMPLAKIYSRQTYNRCMRELKQYGYIRYIPSNNPFLESLVYLVKLQMESGPFHKNKG